MAASSLALACASAMTSFALTGGGTLVFFIGVMITIAAEAARRASYYLPARPRPCPPRAAPAAARWSGQPLGLRGAGTGAGARGGSS